MNKVNTAEDTAIRKALMIVIIHTLLLFCFGALLWLRFMMVPLWITALLVLVWVPQSYFRAWKAFNNPAVSQEKRKKDCAALIFLAALCVPYLVLPGFLFSYPISDLGFRLIVGNRLQSCVTGFLKQPDAKIKKSASLFASIVDRSVLPPCVRKMKPGFVTLGGQTPADRNLGLVYGSGFGHWGFLIGSPQFHIKAEDSRIRRMWPGVYCYRKS